MDLQTILDGIEGACKQQIRQIDENASERIDQITLKARQEAGEQEKRIVFDGRARLNREQALIAQQAVVRSLQIHADARQVLIEEVLQAVRSKIDQIRGRKDYAGILAQLVNETIEGLQPSLMKGQQIVIHFDEHDKGTTKEILKKYTLPLEANYDIHCAGGCTAETEDKMVSVSNTLESRFEQASSVLQQKLSIFFEGKSSTG